MQIAPEMTVRLVDQRQQQLTEIPHKGDLEDNVTEQTHHIVVSTVDPRPARVFQRQKQVEDAEDFPCLP